MDIENAHRVHHEGIHDQRKLLEEQWQKMENPMSTDNGQRDLPAVVRSPLAARLNPRRKMISSEIALDSHNHQMTRNTVVGVLALQGAFYEHLRLLKRASQEVASGQDGRWEFVEVRTAHELERCDALIIPGGESTTVSLVAARSNLLEPLRDFVKQVHHSKDLL